MIEGKKDESVYIEVAGAGQIKISESCGWSCGGKEGFSFGVEWGKHGYAGGVISKEDAIRLAQHIMRTAALEELGI